ncbi:site-2 protease family protein [Endothiovibrio diazotrophicus]
MEELSLVQRIVVWALPVLFAITVHETAHGWMARRLGDHTAEMLGRLTLNPLKHIDPLGTILVPGLLLMLGGFLFGWAKPVPINTRNLHQPKRDMALVAAAGPLSNLLMALFWALVVHFGLSTAGEPVGGAVRFLIYVGVAGVFINTLLMVLNLLPLPPLDGGRVLTGLLPGRAAYHFGRIEPYGFLILLALLATGLLSEILWPPVSLLLAALAGVAGLEPQQLSAVIAFLMH